MNIKKILAIPGDGIGPEIMAEAIKLLDAVQKKFSLTFEVFVADWGADKWLKEGIGLPQDALTTIPKKYDAILFGALGDNRIPNMAHGREILLGLRFGLDLYCNIRPIKLSHSRYCPLKHANDIDMVIFRENTQDLYLGRGSSLHQDTQQEETTDESFHTYHGVKRIVTAAFEYAQNNKRKKVTLVDKSNAIKFGGSLWQRVFQEVSKHFPSIASNHLFVDVAAMKMVTHPQDFDVIVTGNLFGDILSDLGAGLVGGLGVLPSASLNSSFGLFEPVHGSAIDIAKKNLANPFAMFSSTGMMMDFLGYKEIAQQIQIAIDSSICAQEVTPDLGGTLSCSESADKAIDRLMKR